MSTELPNLVEVDYLEIQVIIDNELDPMTAPAPDTVQMLGGTMGHIAMSTARALQPGERGDAIKEIRMEDICCSAHGLSIMVTAIRGDIKHTVLFDAGPEEQAWKRNVNRLKTDISQIEVIQLSHWHRDHSGGIPEAIRMIKKAKRDNGHVDETLVVDVHPDRPDYRGFDMRDKIISLEADPTFEEMENNGARVSQHSETHTILDDMFLISGEIPRETSYETGAKFGMRFDKSEGEWITDEKIADERLLMCNLKGKGIVVFTGCSHAGVVNTSCHAKNLLGGKVPLHAVVGGYHLSLSDDKTTNDTVADLKKLDPAVLLPGHCTGWRAKFAIEKAMPGNLQFLLSAGNAHRNNHLLDFFNARISKHASPACPNCIESNFTGGRRYFLTREPDHIKAVLTGNFADYGKGKVFHDLWSPFLGDSIFTTDGKSWSNSRQLIRPMFIKDRISDLEIFERRTQIMMGLFANPGQTFDIMDLFYRMTLDVTTEFLLGHGIHSLENPKAGFVQAFADVQRMQMALTVLQPIQHFIPKGGYYRGIKTINDFVIPFVQEALELPHEELEKRGRSEKSFTFLHSLANFTRDPKVIRDQVVAVLLAGRDTTAATLSWLIYEIAHYPEIVKKLREEILSTVGPSRAPTYDDLKNMTYLKHTVNETLRLYPAVPFNIRFALADSTLPSGGGPNGDLPLSVLKGDGVIYSTLAMQRRADLYPPTSEQFADPAIFSPERWESWQPKAWQYIPFNGGPRICIGQNFALAEVSYAIVRIVQRYDRIEYDGSWEDQFHKAEIVGTPGMGVKVKMWPAKE
ncbi:cytochrome P450 [Talaromyces proteolyticus]|uniref:Cytochrome P450 n=1 Tax=Talaromyces proteolyticus TaxID=1131652 RepID=A0AAD4L104_9EURO|nr:cytochrome P450 [Talaromyces proteolyticus]KAH8703530.1 cytochrome P450 [Talaromyces proteolyticus]